MKKIGMKFISGFISMIMMVNLIMPMGVYASVDTTDETVIEETVDEEIVGEEEEIKEEQLTTASGAETVGEEEETKEEESASEADKKEEISKPFSESKTIGDVTITVKAEAGAFPEGSYLEVKEIASDMDMSSVKADKIADKQYTGRAIRPDDELKLYTTVKSGKNTVRTDLVQGTDYEIVLCYNNIKKGTATYLLRGKGDYTGFKTVTFKIKQAKFKKRFF